MNVYLKLFQVNKLFNLFIELILQKFDDSKKHDNLDKNV